MVIDAHCDALYKMWIYDSHFYDDPDLDVNYKKWMKSPVKVQCFAIYIPEFVPTEARFSTALQMVDLFYEQIIKPFDNIRHVQSKADIVALREDEKGAILTLEGLDCIGSDLFKLRILFRLGIQMVGMSWNNPNYAVDGIGENRGAGLTTFGKKVIQLANQEKKWTDLAHISKQGFKEALELAMYPIVSHANSASICRHPRNLSDNQIQQIIDKNGLIGITFVDSFVSTNEKATVKIIIQHIQHMLDLGAEHTLILGSDFDGTDSFTEHLTSIDHYSHLLTAIQNNFTELTIKQISFQNFLNRFPQ